MTLSLDAERLWTCCLDSSIGAKGLFPAVSRTYCPVMDSSPARSGGREGPLPPPVPDSVDRILAAWAEQAPELPVAPVGVVTRLARVRLRLDEELAGLFAQYDLSA